ncbi:biliverdin-producing heme oxygenase [Sphingomonas kyeonggiensis]|uniref:Heme oxygenase n=1 Tax=Sphingomonas kyeonggiensis TaxID=1268553 RepID=A0A7W6JRR1_9SPHN|nr:biliverdin-producing heme oxygenase [Sphingomonas kyeonggiensis]MBB4098397.1 heme oxygenase [Sphingomonas kyeonggiensis]
MRNPVHQALRDGTAEAHDRVDAAFADFDLTDRDSYARFLAAHADVVWPLEAALPGERVVEDWESRKRGALLREDLAFLRDTTQNRYPAPNRHPDESRDLRQGSEEGAARDPGFRRDDEMGDAWSEARIAGTLYVLEGSRLGGKFLSRRLPAGFPRAYLDTDQRAEKWQQLLMVIDRLLRDPIALDKALAAALATFAAFERSADNWRKVGIGDGH